jgi:alpha-tubulin suppressor-like RCC1 family protein
MSATFESNVLVTSNVLVQGTGTLYAAVNVASGNVTTSYGNFSAATGIGFGWYNYHTALVMNDGTVRVCGRNNEGQLGQNDLANRSTVVTVIGICSQAVAVSCGKHHTVVLMNDGTVRACGRNDSGQLGQNDVITRSTVVSILGISSQAIAVACGAYHTAILMNNGTVRMCGINTLGELGQNDIVNRSTVVPVVGISSQAIGIACGRHTAILMNNGTVRVCGRNDYGNLGQNDLTNRSTVVPVLGISSQAVAIACGNLQTFIIMNNGTVRGCGANNTGQLGQNDILTRSTVVSVLGISSQAVAVASGYDHTVIVMNDGTLRSVGRNEAGQLGLNDIVTRSTVVSVTGVSQAVAVGCGNASTYILLNDGTVRVCGANEQGQLGQNELFIRVTVAPLPYLVSSTPTLLKQSQATFIGTGDNQEFTAFVMGDGTVRVCGVNDQGQLGQNDLVVRSTVVSVLGISSQAISVACGANNIAILMNDGTVRVCGRNDLGQLGQNDLVTRSTVVSVLGISSQAVAIACGDYHTVILMNDGTVRVCGWNGSGQLGQNDKLTRSTVVSVLGICSQAVAIAAGNAHTAILMDDGTVRGVGEGGYGQLGQNNGSDYSTPVPILGISSQAVAIACGRRTTIILMNDGTVRTCGENSSGQLGQNDLVQRSTVVPILGISSQAISIAGSRFNTLILLNDGTVRACGLNTEGQLGQNDLIGRSTVVSVLGISSQAVAIACGQRHNITLMSDGTVRVYGRNTNGQLGQNNTSNRSTPVPIVAGMPKGNETPASTISLLEQNPISQLWTSSMAYITALIMSDGTIRACGRNERGQLGQNDLVQRSTVVPILGISSQAVSVACSRVHTAILMNDGTVRACGRNNNCQLGLNDLIDRSTVVPVLGISSQAMGVACGKYHTAILMNDGTVRVCGLNASGQLGQNDVITRSTVVTILGISSQAIAVACGFYHTAILMNDGTVRVCGDNSFGQLGQNDVITRSTVVSILGISSQAIAIACGQYHTTILMNDGTVRVCGVNGNGQLGLNDLINRSTVVSVLGISQAVAVSCGEQTTLVLLNNGTVWVGGLNSFGRLGQNDSLARSTLVPILGISSQAVAIAGGANSTAVLMSDGTVRICGRNNFGQLGQNNTAVRTTVVPITIGMPTNAILIAPALNLGPVTSQAYQLDMSTDNARKLTTTTWTTGSDEALKTDIVTADLERCVEIVSNLDLKYFKWEIPSDDKHSLGWIAQEVEQFFPKAVQTNEAHGIPDFKNLNSDQLIKVMWGALKKLRADLKAKQTS